MRILLAEDDQRIAGFISRGLQEEGYLVQRVTDGEQALEFATADPLTPFELIILDILMPKRDGLSVCRELRTRGIHVPILMLTALDTLDDRVRGLDSGADDYLVKPFAFPELMARLRALSRRMPIASKTNVLQIGDLQLDTVAHTAQRGNRRIDLSSREYHLLEYLMRHVGRPVSRTSILQAIWSFDYDGASNVVDVYVGYLRRKIDHEGEPPLVHTVRGVGYKIAESP
ncbi:MAG: response regulator transcription factor [Chloroflexi bacterium]|nr:response regulator transcription factor [Chloroflexota bacterium]MCL5274336.1 response regulator transcription factor [Chloroflexota bacterium]